MTDTLTASHLDLAPISHSTSALGQWATAFCSSCSSWSLTTSVIHHATTTDQPACLPTSPFSVEDPCKSLMTSLQYNANSVSVYTWSNALIYWALFHVKFSADCLAANQDPLDANCHLIICKEIQTVWSGYTNVTHRQRDRQREDLPQHNCTLQGIMWQKKTKMVKCGKKNKNDFFILSLFSKYSTSSVQTKYINCVNVLLPSSPRCAVYLHLLTYTNIWQQS